MTGHIEHQSLLLELESEPETASLAAALAQVLQPNDVVGLIGTLGAGKTRLVRGIAETLGVDPGAISSPTFVLIHEYEGRFPVFHFDAYRLPGPAAFEALGVSDYWSAGGLCLVEWADRVSDVLPDSVIWIRLDPTGPSSRRVRIDWPDPHASESLPRLAHLLGLAPDK